MMTREIIVILHQQLKNKKTLGQIVVEVASYKNNWTKKELLIRNQSIKLIKMEMLVPIRKMYSKRSANLINNFLMKMTKKMAKVLTTLITKKWIKKMKTRITLRVWSRRSIL
jgi:fumarate hydratase class II